MHIGGALVCGKICATIAVSACGDAMETSRQHLVLFWSRHYTVSKIPDYITTALELAVDEFQPAVSLEEWSERQREEAGAAALAGAKGVPWESIGTPDAEEFATYDCPAALDFWRSGTCNVAKYGPKTRCVKISTKQWRLITRQLWS